MWSDMAFLKKALMLAGKVATGFMLIPIFFALRKWKYLNKPLKIFLWYCIATFLVSLIHQLFIWGNRLLSCLFCSVA